MDGQGWQGALERSALADWVQVLSRRSTIAGSIERAAQPDGRLVDEHG